MMKVPTTELHLRRASKAVLPRYDTSLLAVSISIFFQSFKKARIHYAAFKKKEPQAVFYINIQFGHD